MRVLLVHRKALEPLHIIEVPDTFVSSVQAGFIQPYRAVPFLEGDRQTVVQFDLLRYYTGREEKHRMIIVIEDDDVAAEILAGDVEPFTDALKTFIDAAMKE